MCAECGQVPRGGILVTGAGHGYPHGNSGRDCGDLVAVGDAGRAGSHELHRGPLHVQEPELQRLHAVIHELTLPEILHQIKGLVVSWFLLLHPSGLLGRFLQPHDPRDAPT